MKRFDSMQIVFTLLGGLLLLFILAPIAAVFLRSELPDLVQTVADEDVRRSIGLTLWTSMGATLLCALPAIPLAWLLARRRFPFHALVTGIIDLPIVIPHSAAGIALLGVFAKNTPVGGALAKVGLEFVSTPAGIMVAMAFVSIPFLINSARNGFQSVPERLELAALNLGASPARVFFTISMPLAWRAILTGFVLMWARGMSEFGAVVIIAYHPIIAPVMIYERFGAFGLKHALPMTAVFVTICLLLFIVLRMLAGDRGHAAT